ncbi:MAG: hypothetical protein GTO14_14910 [Anaerolineales bacterium]|nr:hypothetical protein [Anaerolineales bacterium]
MSAPFFIFVITGIVALLVLPVRGRTRLAAGISAVGAVLIAGFTLGATLEEPFVLLGLPIKLANTWRVLGRALVLDEGNRAAVAFLYFVGAFVFGGGWISRPSRAFYFVGLASLSVVAASFMIRPFLFAAIFLELAAMGAVLLLVSRDSPARSGGLRLLILYSLAMLAILITGWILESVGVTTATPDLAYRATLLLALGFSILMAVPPFHFWLPTAAGESNPYALAFVTIILQSAGLFFMLRFLDTYAWLRESEILFVGIRFAATAMVCLGSLWALAQRSISKLMAYALLTDFGVMLLAVGTNKPEGFLLALGLTSVRAVSVTVLGIGLTALNRNEPDQDEGQYRGAAYRAPFAVAAVLVGLLSLAGFPLTAGFPGRWAFIATLTPVDPLASASILLALLSLGGMALRWAGIFFSAQQSEAPGSRSRLENLFIASGVLVCVLLGIFPQLLYPWVVQAAAGMSQLLP